MVGDPSKAGTAETEATFTIKTVTNCSPAKISERESGLGAKLQIPGKGNLSPWVSTRPIRHETPQKDDELLKKSNNVTDDNEVSKTKIPSLGTDFRNGRSETLRMKLWEVLGDASQKKQVPTDGRTESSKRKILPDTDTIESDSGNKKKPVEKENLRRSTRTFARSAEQKKEPIKTRSKRDLGKNAEIKSAEKSIFTFNDCEKKVQGSKFAVTGSSLKKIDTKCSRIEPRKISFSGRSTSTKISHSSKSLQSTDKNQPVNPTTEPENAAPHHDAKEKDEEKPQKYVRDSGGSLSPVNEFITSRKIQNFSVDQAFSPTLNPDASPTLNPGESPMFNPENSATPPFQNSGPKKCGSPAPSLSEKNSASDSKSPVTSECSSDSYEPHEEQTGNESSSSGSPLLRRSARLPIFEERKKRAPHPSLETPFYNSEALSADSARSPSTLDPSPQDDNLGRAIAQLAQVLDKFKAKIRSYASRKGFEILSAARDSVHLRLQEVEHLIQAEAEKLAGHGRSKRKRLEAAFFEQEEKLKAAYDRFREEVDRQLAHCRGSLEDLETYEEELKGTIDRQKSTQKKLIQQVELAVEAQLADAEASVVAIQKAARRKMNGLREALREWMMTSDDT
ncbi:asynaptic protein [Wolffia australiana]